nr:MAG TPA: hypothetical protein [Caudoviricetes sp.]
MFWRKQKRIEKLECLLNAKTREADALHQAMEGKLMSGQCKNEYCSICKHFRGLLNGVMLCAFSDNIPCEKFEAAKIVQL